MFDRSFLRSFDLTNCVLLCVVRSLSHPTNTSTTTTTPLAISSAARLWETGRSKVPSTHIPLQFSQFSAYPYIVMPEVGDRSKSQRPRMFTTESDTGSHDLPFQPRTREAREICHSFVLYTVAIRRRKMVCLRYALRCPDAGRTPAFAVVCHWPCLQTRSSIHSLSTTAVPRWTGFVLPQPNTRPIKWQQEYSSSRMYQLSQSKTFTTSSTEPETSAVHSTVGDSSTSSTQTDVPPSRQPSVLHYLHMGPSGDAWVGTEIFAAKHLQPNYVRSIALPSLEQLLQRSSNLDDDDSLLSSDDDDNPYEFLVQAIEGDAKLQRQIYDSESIPPLLLEQFLLRHSTIR